VGVSCTPNTCSGLGYTCGQFPDGCGGVLNCGTCASPDTCGGGGQVGKCGCTPRTCAQQGFQCGIHTNGCGQTLTCPLCGIGKVCQNGQCISTGA
jgi:hypothetical protein